MNGPWLFKKIISNIRKIYIKGENTEAATGVFYFKVSQFFLQSLFKLSLMISRKCLHDVR